MKAASFGVPGLLGNVAAMKNRPLEFLRDAQQHGGPITRLRLGPFLAHLIAEPEGIKRVLVDHSRNYDRDMRQFELISLALGEGLLTTSGESWFQQRRVAQPAFHRQRIAQLAGLMSEIISRQVRSLVAGEVNLSRFGFEVSFELSLKTLFGTDAPVDRDEFARAIEVMTSYVDTAMTAAVTFPLAVPTPANRRFLEARRLVDAVCLKLIAHGRRREAGGADLLSFLIESRDEDTGEGMSDAQLLDHVKSFLLAGYETTAHTVSWIFHLLGQSPQWLDKLATEAREVLGDRPVTLHDCACLTLTTRVIKETMRLYPAGWLIGRNTVADDVVCGREVPKGSMIFVAPWVTHRMDSLWPDPERFDPDRFSPEAERARPKHAYLPFGAGPHLCIGQAFAMMELQMIVASLVQRWDVAPSVGPLSPNPRVTLGPEQPLRARLSPRAQ